MGTRIRKIKSQKFTSRLMEALADSIGKSYRSTYEHKLEIRRIGRVWARTNKKLFHKVWELIEAGLIDCDETILLNSSDYMGFAFFEKVEG